MTAPAPPAARCPASGDRPTPRIVLRTGQRIVRGPLRITADGIAYPDPRPDDRDAEGILWPRIAGEETGAPLYADINPRKQRAAMEDPQRLLCQVGMGPATVTPDGVLWIVPRPTGSPTDPVRTGWPTGRTSEPPVCAAHAPLAARWCPRLRLGGHAALLVRRAPLVAVEGTLYRPTGDGRVEARQRAVFDLDEHDGHQEGVDARFLLGEYLVRQLEDVTPVDLRDPELYRDAVPCDAGH
ncbi:hypothetical protein [Streptomyces sp. NPDC057854]|uniref:hypothetical protein n=1 Tax=unclassified Streptomyces TaxID=2593676 RepID=UPI00367F252C